MPYIGQLPTRLPYEETNLGALSDMLSQFDEARRQGMSRTALEAALAGKTPAEIKANVQGVVTRKPKSLLGAALNAFNPAGAYGGALDPATQSLVGSLVGDTMQFGGISDEERDRAMRIKLGLAPGAGEPYTLGPGQRRFTAGGVEEAAVPPEYKPRAPIAVGQGGALFDPVTGEVVYERTAPPRVIGVGAGGSLMDSEGNVIGTAPPAPRSWTEIIGELDLENKGSMESNRGPLAISKVDYEAATGKPLAPVKPFGRAPRERDTIPWTDLEAGDRVAIAKYYAAQEGKGKASKETRAPAEAPKQAPAPSGPVTQQEIEAGMAELQGMAARNELSRAEIDIANRKLAENPANVREILRLLKGGK
ncbi:MAG TPA: hypothetical protein VMY87_06215 [Armatimonadota bacterium]|nr:hypothetical protein [Armatimonadota bacterium]